MGVIVLILDHCMFIYFKDIVQLISITNTWKKRNYLYKTFFNIYLPFYK